MATRVYFPNSLAAPVAPAFGTAWTHASSGERYGLTREKTDAGLVVGRTMNGSGAAMSLLDRQYVSDPLAAQSLPGTTWVKGQLMVREFAVTDNMDEVWLRLALVDSAGTTELTQLKSLQNWGPTSEFINNATLRNFTITASTAVNSWAIAEGSRLVLELGYRNSAAGTTPQAAARWGSPAAVSDLPENGTDTASGVAWIEVSETLVFLGDPVANSVYVSDGLYVVETATMAQAERTVHAIDTMAMLDPSARDQGHGLLDRLALGLGDSHVAWDRAAFAQDTVLLDTQARRHLERVLAAFLLLRDTVTAETAAGPQTYTRTVTDTLLLLSRLVETTERLLREPLLLYAPPLTGLDLTLTDAVLVQDTHWRDRHLVALAALFLRDAVTPEQTSPGGTVLTRDLLDTLLVYDQRLSALERLLREPVLLADDDLRQTLHDLTLADGLFLVDARVSTLERRLLASLLLLDTVSIQTAGVILRTAVDGLLLLDAPIREQAHGHREGLFLADAVFRDLVLTLLDRLLVADSVATLTGGRVVELTATDRLLLAETLSQARELLAREGVILGEAAVAQYVAVVVAALVAATLRTADLLGLQMATRDLLGLRLESRDLLGITLGVVAAGEGG